MTKLLLLALLLLSPLVAHAANEIILVAPEYTGQTMYMLVFDDDGEAWNGSAFATFTTTQADFDVAMTEVGSTGLFRGTIPGTSGFRSVVCYLRASGTPANTDQALQTDAGYFDTTLGWKKTLPNLDAPVSEVGDGLVDTRDLDEVQHVWRIQSTGDGSWRSTPESTLYLTPGADGVSDFRAGFDCNIPSICPNGSTLSLMGNTPVFSSSDGTIAKLGIGPNGLKQPMMAKVELDVDANPTAGTFWARAHVSNSLGGGPMTVYGKVVLLEAPSD